MRQVVGYGLIFGIVAMTVSPANAQFRMYRADNRNPARITPEIDRTIQQAMQDAERSIKAEQYVPAAIQMQAILDHPEDFFLQRDLWSKTGPFRSVKERTCRILADSPENVLATYELNYGATARTLLTDAIQKSDYEQIAEVVRHYEMTTAGYEALRILAEAAFDKGRPLEAALLCESLMNHPLASKQPAGPMMLRTAFAWYLAGNSERSIAALNSLKGFDSFANWRIGAKKISPIQEGEPAADWMAANFGTETRPAIRTVREWVLPRAGTSNNESATLAFPIGGEAWSVSPYEHIRLKFDDSNTEWKNEFHDRIEQLVKDYRDRNQLIMPVTAPVVVGDVVAFRTPNDVTAVDLKTGRLRWRTSMTDGVLSLLSQRPLSTMTVGSYLGLTLTGHLMNKEFQDRLSGTLTSDGKSLFAIEEAGSLYNMPRPQFRQRVGDFQSAVPTNKLVAYELSTGRLVWEAGGMRGTEPVELSGSYFLGPPVPYEGRLYCLAEMKDELCLVCITYDGQAVQMEWSQSLISINRSTAFSTLRRQSGLMPAIIDGIAICPTSSGSVVAFDLVHRQLRWGYAYELQNYFFPPDGFGVSGPSHSDDDEPRWADGNPLLVNSRAIVTPLDSAEIHCVSAVDGSVYWKKPRHGGAYVACVNENAVIIVGRTQVVALALADGAELWTQPIEIAPPSGRGVRIEAKYLLPLSTGEIATLDLAKGQIIARSSLSNGRVPGNLAIRNGTLVTCGTGDVVAFRPLDEIETQIAGLTKNPDDAEALALRGELRLHEGEIDSAIADMRESLRRRPSPNVKRALAGTLLNSSIENPERLLSVASELETLVTEPAQRIEFLRAYVRSLIETGNRTEAVQQLFRVAETPMKMDELIAVEPGYFISLWQSVRSQLLVTFENSQADEKSKIVRIFENEFESVTDGPEKDRRLARLIDLVQNHPAASPSLKRLLAAKEMIADESLRRTYLERLTQSHDTTVAALATARLASELLESNSVKEAVPWIVSLNRNFASEVCLNDRTGKQLYDEWMTRDDVRAARKPVAVWPDRPIQARKTREHLERMSFPIWPETHVGNHFEGWTFEIDTNNGDFTARDPSLRVVWRFHRVGLVDVSRMPVIQLHIREQHMALSCGMYLALLKCSESSSEPKLLFERSLRTEVPSERRQFDMRPRKPVIGLSAEAVFYQMENRLFAADVESGRILWTRNGAQYSRSTGTVDELLALHTVNHDALLLRPLDGTVLQQHKGNLDESPIWIQGTRRLSQRNEGLERRTFEMRDVNGDRVLWQSQHQEGTLASIVDGDEVAFLEPSGKLSIVELASGKMILTAESPVVRPHATEGALAVQKYGDRYVVFAGGSVDKRLQPPIFIPKLGLSNEENSVVDGFAFAIDRNNASIVWSVPIKQMAYDTFQPTNIPVMVLGARQNEIDRPGQQHVSVLILDKRNGKVVFEEPRNLSPVRDSFGGGGRGVQFDPRIDDEKLIIDFYNWNVALTFPDETKPAN